ncbi:hypothetical protein T261_4794 [Streptomyces lydicus]|nr:hypothetical protein T261_4794 [Streptomyces lydicus]
MDLAEADPTVGTSAGAIVGAVPATGQDPERLATPPRPAGSTVTPPQVDRHDPSAWEPAYRARVRQAADTVQRAGASWHAPVGSAG